MAEGQEENKAGIWGRITGILKPRHAETPPATPIAPATPDAPAAPATTPPTPEPAPPVTPTPVKA